jgi:lipid II:glycine glycyltransferase (peptidoglycan interpeptide bridge formation enzyme)
MAPHLLHWQAIKFAKENNFLNYDFGGIRSEKFLSPNQENWTGLTRFKTGFAPNTVPTEFMGLWEYPLKPVSYFGYKMLGKLVRVIRKIK